MAAAPVITIFVPGVEPIERLVDRSPFVIGRDRGAHVVLDHPFISRRQVVLELDGGEWTARSEGRNEVKIDGRTLELARPIGSSAKFSMGPITVVFTVRESEGSPPSVAGSPFPAASQGARGGEREFALDDAPELGSVTMELELEQLLEGRRHLALLADLSGKMSALSDDAAIARLAAQAVAGGIGARAACVVDGGRLLGSAGAPIARLSRSLVERSLSGRTVIALESDAMIDELGDAPSLHAHAKRPVLIGPLGAPVSGVLYAEGEVGAASFSTEDAGFFTVLAHLAGAAIGAARTHRAVIDQRDRLARDVERRSGFGALIGSSAGMLKLAQSITKVAPSDTTVLITGETGTGKELVARELHQRSARCEGPFFALNCAALPENLIESELFGHKKGAFSGAERDRAGIFELAASGTVFLDEIGELPLVAQAKILRVLDAKEILPLGGGLPVKIDARVVAATHRDLDAEVEAGRFRRDLLYRLKVFSIAVPPLRERREDILRLVEHFFAASPEARKKQLSRPTEEALEALSAYAYPGNVRELLHLIEQAVILAEEGEALDVAHLPEAVLSSVVPPVHEDRGPKEQGGASVPLRTAIADFERALIVRELEKDGWNRTATAKRLEVPLRSFMDRLKRLGIRGR